MRSRVRPGNHGDTERQVSRYQVKCSGIHGDKEAR